MKKIYGLPLFLAALLMTSLQAPSTINQKLVEEFDIISKDKSVSEELPKEEKGSFFDRFKQPDKDEKEDDEVNLLKTEGV